MSNLIVDAYVRNYYFFAVKSELSTQVPTLFSLGQGALESLWGQTVEGNNIFGIKDTDGVNGNEQLIGTTEYHTSPNFKYPVINKILQVAPKRWKYSVMDYFRKYDTPAASFIDHGQFLRKNKRYAKAFQYIDPYAFGREVARAGYATDPDYENKLMKVIRMVEKSLAQLNDL